MFSWGRVNPSPDPSQERFAALLPAGSSPEVDPAFAKLAKGYAHKRAESELGVQRFPGQKATTLALATIRKNASLEQRRDPEQPQRKPTAVPTAWSS